MNRKIHELRGECYHEWGSIPFFKIPFNKCKNKGCWAIEGVHENKSYDTDVKDTWVLFEELPEYHFLSKQNCGYLIEYHIKGEPVFIYTGKTASEAICKAYIDYKERYTMNENISFIIDTDSYAGNFERELCAYITGQIGECEVGEAEAGIFKKECPEYFDDFYNTIKQTPDDHGCFRPVSIHMSPQSTEYNSIEIYFLEKIPKELVDIMKYRSKNYCLKNNIKIIGFRVKKEVTTTTFNYLDK